MLNSTLTMVVWQVVETMNDLVIKKNDVSKVEDIVEPHGPPMQKAWGYHTGRLMWGMVGYMAQSQSSTSPHDHA